MKSNDKDRIIAFKRIIETSPEGDISKRFIHFSDEELLELLDRTMLPNSLSLNTLKYAIINNLIISDSERKKRVFKAIKDIPNLFKIMTKSERDLTKFGIFYGFDSFNWKYQMHRYITHSSRPDGGDLFVKKSITSYTFEKIFPFVYRLIKGGDKNDTFPRI